MDQSFWIKTLGHLINPGPNTKMPTLARPRSCVAFYWLTPERIVSLRIAHLRHFRIQALVLFVFTDQYKRYK